MKRVILVVDDEERILFVLKNALVKLDKELEVETAATAQEALEKVNESEYDLVISDLIMPDMDGVEFTERIRDRRPDLAIVWMTAYGCRSFANEAKRLNIFSCVEKPLEIQGFRDLAREAMEMDEGNGAGGSC